MAQLAHESPVRLSLHAMLEAQELGSEHSDDMSAGNALAKKTFQPYHAQSVPRKENLEAQWSERAWSGSPVTTMMLRNIPNKYTQNTLMQEIDEEGFAGSFDFFYLPMDVHNRSNVGYAFINFTTAQGAERFRDKFCEHHFKRFQSRKISSVCAAHVQGLDENLHHFKNRAVTQARNSQYRPVVLKGNVRIDFDDAVEEARARSGAAGCRKVQAPGAPLATSTLAECGPPPGLAHAAAGQSRRTKKGAIPPRVPQEGLELAIRDLTNALQYGQMQREAAVAKSAALARCAPPPNVPAKDGPAYVALPTLVSVGAWNPCKVPSCDSDASTRDCAGFSRACSDFSRASEEL